MPIEIKELIIRAIAVEKPEDGKDDSDRDTSPEPDDAVVQACVRQVLNILKQSRER